MIIAGSLELPDRQRLVPWYVRSAAVVCKPQTETRARRTSVGPSRDGHTRSDYAEHGRVRRGGTGEVGRTSAVFLQQTASLAHNYYTSPPSSKIDVAAACCRQGRSDGGYIGIYALPKSVPGNYFVH